MYTIALLYNSAYIPVTEILCSSCWFSPVVSSPQHRLTVLFNNMRTLYSKVEQQMRFSLPSIKCSATAEQFRCLNCAQRYDYRALGGNRKEPPNIWLTVAKYGFVGWALNFRVRLLLKGAVTSDRVLKIFISLTKKKRQHSAHDETKPHRPCLFLVL